MAILVYLATEGAESGFGLNLDILETNLVNLVIIIGVLFYFGRKFLGNILSQRRAEIETAITEAEQRAKDAEARLKKAQQNLAQAQEEAKRIRAEAEERAQKAKEEVLEKGNAEVERIKANAAADVSAEQDKAIAELRQRVSALALEQVEGRLNEILDDSAQERYIDRCINQLGG
ncbi:F0F1 ATP synthase subunit B [Spirulina sp. CS-785/01]|uniref:F0F1 ATP synthase subunit B n=1 Tax=Spirulina sp. CS-785/01 TaxID=3021716 RepID=UPI00232B6533|nr:F0F1 ATP synthase subunit B [Spirulina sp. CS-785/01]MDB9311842.1 F0F1 ATP synthase subunit B [Spirulina sp. CS-785/01]